MFMYIHNTLLHYVIKANARLRVCDCELWWLEASAVARPGAGAVLSGQRSSAQRTNKHKANKHTYKTYKAQNKHIKPREQNI